MVKLPASSTVAPLAEPFTITDAPINGSPFASFTVPLATEDFCCCTVATSEGALAAIIAPEGSAINSVIRPTDLNCLCIYGLDF